MLAKVLKDNKPFDKRSYLGQYKINGVRCIVGAEQTNDMFNPVRLTYRSREGTDWTSKLTWMDEVILPAIKDDLLDAMIEEGACLDGELYIPGYKVNDINSFVKNEKLPQHLLLQYWCYDIAIDNMSYEARRKFKIDNISRLCYTLILTNSILITRVNLYYYLILISIIFMMLQDSEISLLVLV